MSFKWQNIAKPFFVLAPMEAVTDNAFRSLINQVGRPDVFFTEFTSVEGLFSKGRDSVIQRLKFEPDQQPIIAQIWGLRPENFFAATKLVKEMGFAGVDINMGCPERKIIKHGACAALINNPALACEQISAVKEAAQGKIQISVKTRLGFKEWQTEQWTSVLLNQGLDALTVHGRLAKDMSKYPADWNKIAQVVKLRDQLSKNTVIIGNGDVSSRQDGLQKASDYGVDGLMVGRGIFSNPLFFAANPPAHIDQMSPRQKLEMLLKHIELYAHNWGNTKNFAELKRFFKIYVKGFEGSAELRDQLMHTTSLAQAKEIVLENIHAVD